MQQVAKRHAKDEGRYSAANEQPPVPRAAPVGVANLAAVIKPDRPQEKRPQHHQHGPIETAERGRIYQGPGRKQGATGRNEPDLVALPVRRHRGDDNAAFQVATAHKGQQGAHAHVVAVHDGKADQQHAHQQPPDDLEGCVVKHHRVLRQVRRSREQALRSGSGRCPGCPAPGVQT